MTLAHVDEAAADPTTTGRRGTPAPASLPPRVEAPVDAGVRPATAPRPAQADDAANGLAPDDAWIRAQRVTVLMATYNRAATIEEALDSLLGQTRPPDEVVVVDDGSTDDTAARVRRYGGRVRYLSQANGGKSAAINRGLRAATGDWIWCFDDDDAALPDGLERLLRGLARQRDADFVYGGQRTGASGSDGRIVGERDVLPPDVPSHHLFARGLRDIPFLLPAALVRRTRFEQLKGFDERYTRSMDYEFLLRLTAVARGVRVAAPVFVWRSHDGPRGPQHARHDGALRERVWMEMAGRLGRDLRRRLPLSAYLPPLRRVQALGSRSLRSALLQRMAVMASKGLVREALVDLHSAASLLPANPSAALDRDEARACWELVNLPFFRMRLLDAPDRVVKRLCAAAEGHAGRAMLARIARGTLHAARHADRSAAERRVLLRCALRLFLASGAATSARAYLPARPA